MACERWTTKEEVLNDLRRVTGRAMMKGFDDSCFIVGERPPPAPANYNDDEFKLMFGDDDYDVDYEVTAPDVMGIKQMLQMVNQVDDIEETQQETEKEPEPINILVSKLNPNIDEFQPRAVIKSTDEMVDSNKDEAAKLKEKYFNASKTNCYYMKNQKNIAIASLLKLCCKSDEETKNETEEKASSPVPCTPQAEPDAVAPDSDNIDRRSPHDDTTEQKLAIDKVNFWLKNKMSVSEKRSSPSLYLGPINFTNKTTNSAESAQSVTSDSSQKKHPETFQSAFFKPTDISKNLADRYRAQSKVIPDKKMDFWTKIELQLKEKDEELKNRVQNVDA